NMAALRSANTTPEVRVRQALHARGLRFRLHRRDLPGRPDIVLPRYKAVIFVHGCFWHMHKCAYGKPRPATNADFWMQKREGNVDRDKKNRADLLRAGWQVYTIWECETRIPEKLERTICNIVNNLLRSSEEAVVSSSRK